MTHQLAYRNVMTANPVQYVLNPTLQQLTSTATVLGSTGIVGSVQSLGQTSSSTSKQPLTKDITTGSAIVVAGNVTQLELLKAQNAELQTKLHHVNRENGQLNEKVERIRADLIDLKGLIERCNATLNSGMSVDSK